MALRAGRLGSFPLCAPGSRAAYSSDYGTATRTVLYSSCHTHGDNLVKSGGCTDIAILDTQDSNRKSIEIGESPPTHLKA